MTSASARLSGSSTSRCSEIPRPATRWYGPRHQFSIKLDLSPRPPDGWWPQASHPPSRDPIFPVCTAVPGLDFWRPSFWPQPSGKEKVSWNYIYSYIFYYFLFHFLKKCALWCNKWILWHTHGSRPQAWKWMDRRCPQLCHFLPACCRQGSGTSICSGVKQSHKHLLHRVVNMTWQNVSELPWS